MAQSSRVAVRFLSCHMNALAIPNSLSLRRKVHASVYDKNPEEQAEVVRQRDIDLKADHQYYWCPHPQTGVFGPAKDHKPADDQPHFQFQSEFESHMIKPFFRPLDLQD